MANSKNKQKRLKMKRRQQWKRRKERVKARIEELKKSKQ